MKTINATRGTVNDYYELPAQYKVGDNFIVNKQLFLVVTDEQALSFERTVRHQGRETYEAAHYLYFDSYLGVQFNHIFIGIERDGYAHS